MTDQQVINTYAAREKTIRELAEATGRSYQDVRHVLIKAGYHNTKHSHSTIKN